eukprot:952641-Pelagomonas_calceolata.AAC.4
MLFTERSLSIVCTGSRAVHTPVLLAECSLSTAYTGTTALPYVLFRCDTRALSNALKSNGLREVCVSQFFQCRLSNVLCFDSSVAQKCEPSSVGCMGTAHSSMMDPVGASNAHALPMQCPRTARAVPVYGSRVL